ncbi:MAG: hypothetical protein KOO63_05485 [Bacteroidales bacterium]|nr:hypothetical protein [Candidatus Latescibacterota bacterium]
MDNNIREAIADVYKTRASKEEVKNLRRIFYWLIGIVAAAAVSVVGTGFANYKMHGDLKNDTNGRIVKLETKVDGFIDRQKENNELLKEIERLLRE